MSSPNGCWSWVHNTECPLWVHSMGADHEFTAMRQQIMSSRQWVPFLSSHQWLQIMSSQQWVTSVSSPNGCWSWVHNTERPLWVHSMGADHEFTAMRQQQQHNTQHTTHNTKQCKKTPLHPQPPNPQTPYQFQLALSVYIYIYMYIYILLLFIYFPTTFSLWVSFSPPLNTKACNGGIHLFQPPLSTRPLLSSLLLSPF